MLKNETIEKTFVIIKPDGVKRRLVGEIIKRIEEKDLNVISIRNYMIHEEEIAELYKESLLNFPQIKQGIIEYMTQNHSILIIVEGENAIQKVREIRGSSNPITSKIGSIRRDFAGEEDIEELTKKGIATKNIMHASGNKEEVEKEIKLFFNKNEI